MHSKEEIIQKTRLTEERIAETIQKRQQVRQQQKQEQQQPNRGPKERTSVVLAPQPKSKAEESEITELKGSIKELIEIMKAVYEFEDA